MYLFMNDMQILINWKIKFEADITVQMYSIQMTIL